MAKKIKISDIARMAGVSAGTVDRVVHGRGKVSESSRIAVEEALRKTGYTPNLHVSSIAIKKHYDIAVTIPEIARGEYWDSIKEGIDRAFEVYRDFDVRYQYFHYNQFDLFSCAEAFKKVVEWSPSAVIIGPTFSDETMDFTNTLSEAGIPYVYIDSIVENTEPAASYCVNQQSCGYLMAKLIRQITPEDSEYVICQAERIGNASANNTIQRKIGFRNYFKENGLLDRINRLSFSVTLPQQNAQRFAEFFREHPQVKGAVVLSSRGSLVANELKKCGIANVSLACLDLTDNNIKALKHGLIDIIICQRPTNQGYLAVKATMMHLIYGKTNSTPVYMPLDIITKENLEYYKELLETL